MSFQEKKTREFPVYWRIQNYGGTGKVKVRWCRYYAKPALARANCIVFGATTFKWICQYIEKDAGARKTFQKVIGEQTQCWRYHAILRGLKEALWLHITQFWNHLIPP